MTAQHEDRQAKYDALKVRIALAYGYLWHVNAGMGAPSEVAPPSMTPEKAALESRKLLRDTMNNEERGNAINAVRQLEIQEQTKGKLKADKHD